MSDRLTTKHRVIVGLGNPGEKYANTRHNMGFLVLQTFAQMNALNFKEEKQFHALVAKGKQDETIIHLLLPLTYMNESGRAVHRYLNFYRLHVSDLIVVVDDTALPFGQMRLRPLGSAGGHNGLKSIETYLGTREYIRLRIGIGQNLKDETLADYVLGKFNNEEIAALPEIVQEGSLILKSLMSESITHVMNRVNTKK